jgi:c(7)-type cytochrome triheme protein
MVVGLIALAGSVAAQNLPKLPADITLPQSADSPGKVTFSHQNHIGFQGRPDCTTCHPKLAPILGQKAQGKRGAITHDKMIKGQACGACHNGKDAHNFDDCSTCHK